MARYVFTIGIAGAPLPGQEAFTIDAAIEHARAGSRRSGQGIYVSDQRAPGQTRVCGFARGGEWYWMRVCPKCMGIGSVKAAPTKAVPKSVVSRCQKCEGHGVCEQPRE